MPAKITDYFNKASDGSGKYPPVATVKDERITGATVLSCDDLAGWATDTPVHFSTFRVNADGAIDPTSQTDWKGIVSGNTITQLTRIAGADDSGNLVGDRVEINPTVGWLSDLVTGLLAAHNQDGTLKDGVVSSAKLASGAVTNAKIGTSAVKSQNIDWATQITPTGPNVIRLGNRKIMWGETTRSWKNGETWDTVTLPESFSHSSYCVFCEKKMTGTTHSHPDLFILVAGQTVSSFDFVVWNSASSAKEYTYKWIAIG